MQHRLRVQHQILLYLVEVPDQMGGKDDVRTAAFQGLAAEVVDVVDQAGRKV